MNYPRYAREQNLSCKLTDKDIKNIQKEYRWYAVTQKQLGKKYNVTASTIGYWVKTDKDRKKRCRQIYLQHRENWDKYKEANRITRRKVRKRKSAIMPEYRKFESERTIAYRKRNLGKHNEYRRKYSKCPKAKNSRKVWEQKNKEKRNLQKMARYYKLRKESK